ncbi:MAG: crosslink repair DNA glycosylase YcaQ family protein [Elusimicrobiota bacterium]
MTISKTPRPVRSSLGTAEARRRVLSAQGLLGAPRFGEGKAGALAAIEHLGYVQIDTISVVERAHHHTLWARVPGYLPAHLQELQARDRKVFEYWSHAAAYLPLRDYRFALRRMEAYARGKRHWFRRDDRTHRYVLDRIRAEGPLRARDFDAPAGHRGGSWFEWKPAKKALEQLFWCGELMVRERRGFEKVFDLRGRVLPAGTDTRLPSEEEFLRHHITAVLRAQGLAAAREISYRRALEAARLGKVLREMLAAGEAEEFEVEGAPGEIYYGLKDFPAAAGRAAEAGEVRILSPFDNLVIQRKRLARLFGYEYQVECYVPEPKRKFGYFCLPLVRDTAFIGRVDAKADRAAGLLRVERFHWESAAGPAGRHRPAVKAALERFAVFNGCGGLRGLSKL